jgi:acyl-coenzyme A thioesterase PaaI-like protein
MNFVERLGGEKLSENLWRFDLAEELNGGFGGTNGGVLAALCVFAARDAAPGKRAAGVDARFIRSFRPGPAHITATVLNAGRTLTTVSIDIHDGRDKLATRGTVSLVTPAALSAIDGPASEDPANAETMGELSSYADGKAWREPKGQAIPLIDTFAPRQLGRGPQGTATATRVIWDDPGASAEAACIAADISVGPPVARALAGKPLAIPNPDISLRFSGATCTTDHLISTCCLESLLAGQAMTSIRVHAGPELLAVGVSTTTCLGA